MEPEFMEAHVRAVWQDEPYTAWAVASNSGAWSTTKGAEGPVCFKGVSEMKNKLFIGGLAWATTEDTLRDAVSEYGNLEEVRIITDRNTGRSRGFGFVTFEDEESATKCKDEMDGVAMDGRNIRVDYPREREDRGGGGGGGGGYRSNRSW